MKHLQWMRPLILPVIAAYVLFSVATCAGSGGASRVYQQYDALPYTDTFEFATSQEQLHRALINVVQERGGVVTVSDPVAGLLTAEIAGDAQLPEEAYAAKSTTEESSTGSGVAAVFGVIVAVVAFVFLFGWLGDGCSGCASNTSSSTSVTIEAPKPVRAYKYMITFRWNSPSTLSTSLRVSAIRQLVENGTVTSTQRLQNKYLNYSLRDAIQAELAR